jgi:hypothetical protein
MALCNGCLNLQSGKYQEKDLSHKHFFSLKYTDPEEMLHAGQEYLSGPPMDQRLISP